MTLVKETALKLQKGLVRLTGNPDSSILKDLIPRDIKLDLHDPKFHKNINPLDYHPQCRNTEVKSNVKCVCGEMHIRYVFPFNIKNVQMPVIIGSLCVRHTIDELKKSSNAEDIGLLNELQLIINTNSKRKCLNYDSCHGKIAITSDKHGKDLYCLACSNYMKKTINYKTCICCDNKTIDPLRIYANPVRNEICSECFKKKKCRDCNIKFVSMKFNKYNNIQIRCYPCYTALKNKPAFKSI